MPTPHGLLRLFTPLIVVLSLAGCFKSGTPLLDAAHAKYPFAAITLKNEEGQISLVKRDGDVYRFIEDGKQDATALLIRRAGRGPLSCPGGGSDRRVGVSVRQKTG